MAVFINYLGLQVSKSYEVSEKVLPQVGPNKASLLLEVEVVNGVIENVRVQMPPGLVDSELIELFEHLLKMPFDNQLVNNFSKLMPEVNQESKSKQAFLIQCLDDMVSKFV